MLSGSLQMKMVYGFGLSAQPDLSSDHCTVKTLYFLNRMSEEEFCHSPSIYRKTHPCHGRKNFSLNCFFKYEIVVNVCHVWGWIISGKAWKINIQPGALALLPGFDCLK